MSAEPNTPELWDDVWTERTSAEQHRHELAREELSIRWRRIEERVRARLGDPRGLRVVEIGAGAGTNAGVMARRGASVTLLDYSDRALDRAREFFAANGLEAELVEADALDPPAELLGRFDVSMSFGLNEHFTGEDRVRIFRSHLDVLRPGGIAFVSVPNARNVPYRASKWLAERTGQWKLGVEVPFTGEELEAIARRLGVSEIELFGDSFAYSLRFVNPWWYLSRRVRREPRPPRLRRERGTPLDRRWSYATVLMMVNAAEDP